MKSMTINIVKKNRAYFKCVGTNGFEFKLKINELSENLPLGVNELLVNDISIRTKYGTDVIYEVAAEKEAGFVTLQHFEYNSGLVERCRELGGEWDAESKAWVFNAIVEDKIEELEEVYNSELVAVEITAKEDVFFSQAPVEFLGYTLARAWGRDSGAEIHKGVSLISGKATSAGSMKNWGTEIIKGSVLRLSVPRKLLETRGDTEADNWEIKIHGNAS